MASEKGIPGGWKELLNATENQSKMDSRGYGKKKKGHTN